MSESPEDQQLLASIAQRNERAMETFYRRHAGPLTGFLQRTLNNPADVAEVVNAVMLEVWHKGHTYAGQSSVRTWLYSMARFKAIDALRRKARHEDHDDVSLHEDIACDCDPLAAHAGAQQADQVRRCMDGLKSSFRQVVYLTFFEGLAYPDIAGILDIPTGTVKTRMMKARQLLMACLAGA